MKSTGKDLSAVTVGIVLIVASIVYYQMPFTTSDAGRLISGLFEILSRIFCCIWISEIAKKQNRKPLGYVVLGILLPAITLIIVGLLGNKTSKDPTPQDF